MDEQPTSAIGEGRSLRVCDLCGGVDDHPRHVLAGGVADAYGPPSQEIVARVLEQAPPEESARLVRELFDTSSQDRHLDCCREAGCPAGTCAEVTAGAEHLRGADLLDHLTGEVG
jgi:hypothetical protein